MAAAVNSALFFHPDAYLAASQPMLRHALEGNAVDILFLAALVVFLLLSLALVKGCAALERRK